MCFQNLLREDAMQKIDEYRKALYFLLATRIASVIIIAAAAYRGLL